MDVHINLAQSPLVGVDRYRWCDECGLRLAGAGIAATVQPTRGRDRVGREAVPDEWWQTIDAATVPLTQ